MGIGTAEQRNLERAVDRMYAEIRKTLTQNLRPKRKQTQLLKTIYGPNWDSSGALPHLGASEAVQQVLATFSLSSGLNPLVIEEYRRLENALNYDRRTFCLDMDGLLIEDGKQIPGMKEYVEELKKRHAVVVSTAAPTEEAKEMLQDAGYNGTFPLVFGVLANARGKNYLPIARYFGYAHPQRRLVAVGHSTADTPADIAIPFLYLDVPQHKLARALEKGVARIERSPTESYHLKTA